MPGFLVQGGSPPNLSVTTAKIVNDAVTTAKITDVNVTTAKIADDAIDSEHYAAGSIDTAHIADNQVTAAKIFDLARGSILIGNASAATAELTKGSANYVLKSDGTDIAWATVETGASTTRAAVGTYSMAYYLPIGGNIALGGTNAGRGLGTKSGCISKSSLGVNGGTNGTLSGTWRNMDAACMTGANIPGGQSNPWGLWVRTA